MSHDEIGSDLSLFLSVRENYDTMVPNVFFLSLFVYGCFPHLPSAYFPFHDQHTRMQALESTRLEMATVEAQQRIT